jgi:hypothetical protein
MNEPTTYLISVIIRDANGKIVEDKKGTKFPQINFEKTVHNYKQLEFQVRNLHRAFKALLPDHDINIEAGLNNRIGGTIMNMASFYGSEDRFVKH